MINRHVVETFLLTMMASLTPHPLAVISSYCFTSILILLFFYWKEKHDQLHAWFSIREQVRILRKSSELRRSNGGGDRVGVQETIS